MTAYSFRRRALYDAVFPRNRMALNSLPRIGRVSLVTPAATAALGAAVQRKHAGSWRRMNRASGRETS